MAQYEVETMLSGKHRDFNVDTTGKLLELEEETTLDALPAAAKAAIVKKAAGGTVGTVERATKGSQTTYEAVYTSKDGKKHEVVVDEAGVQTKH